MKLFLISCICALNIFSISNILADSIDEEWFPVKETSQIIKQGSPLDFSYLVGNRVAGSEGRLTVTRDGYFAFSSRQNKRQRFLCASTDLTSITGGFPSHQMAELYVKQLKIRGYNLVKIHSIEAYLMKGSAQDFAFDQERLDRFFYFLSLLKREGIYWLINGLTSGNGAYGNVKPHRWVNKHQLKSKLYYNEAAKQHWKGLIQALWNKKNPYTGLSTLEDPALFGMILVNENGLNFVLRSGVIPQPLKQAFNSWLKEKYHTTNNLKQRWGNELKFDESVGKGNVAPPRTVKERSMRQMDFQRFIQLKERELATWQIEYLRSIGYQGLVTGYNNWYSLSASKSRSMFGWIDMHYYHDENFMWSPNFKMKQTSSLSDNLKYLRHLSASAELGKPFTVSEYGHAFWNNYRYESGLVFPAIASLQDWDMICQYSQGAIDLSFAPPTTKASRKRAIYPYNIGMDPVLRAGETLSALLFLREDVKPSDNLTIMDFSNEKWLSGRGFDHVSDHINKLSFLSKLRISFDGSVELAKESKPISKNNNIRFLKSADLNSNILLLRNKAFLDQDNRTNIAPENKVFNSDTNEILFDKNKQLFTVKTPKTLAALVNPGQNIQIGRLLLKNASSKGMFSLSSLDGESIEKSSQLLIILTSNARNTNMILSDNDRKLEVLGTFPVLIKRLSVDMSFRTNKVWSFSRLSLTGEEVDTQLLKQSEALEVNIDNYSSKHGPTTYFLLTEVE